MIEFPKTYSALLLGVPGLGKSEYCMHLVKDYLEKGEKAVFVTTEKSPSDIRARMREIGVDLESYEGENFLFIDIFTRDKGTKEEKVLYVDNPANLNLVSVKLSEAYDILGKPMRIIFDSLSTFFLHASEKEIRSFFESINTKIKMNDSFVLFTLHDDMHDEKTVVALKAMVLTVLEMDIEGAPGRKRKIRVAFAKGGVPHSSDWFEFKITGDGFEMGPMEEVKAPEEKARAKGKRPVVKIAAVIALLIAVFVVAPIIFDDRDRVDRDWEDRYAPEVTAAPPFATAAAPADEPSATTETPQPTTPPIEEFRLDGMEDINNWFPMEGGGAFLDISDSTDFSQVGKSMKVSLEIIDLEDEGRGSVMLPNPKLDGYDGVTIWSYVHEPVPLGRLQFSLEEEGGARYSYMRMRNLKKVGWIKDTIPFSDIRLSPWSSFEDENSQLDIDHIKMLSFDFGGGPGTGLETYVFYLDELNLFRYQNASE